MFGDNGMRAASEQVKAAINGLLAVALLLEPRTLLEAMAGRVAAFAQDLVDKQLWGVLPVAQTPAPLRHGLMSCPHVRTSTPLNYQSTTLKCLHSCQLIVV